MTKKELIEKIKTVIKQVSDSSKSSASSQEINLDTVTPPISFDAGRFPILTKFPPLKGILIDLLTDQYESFIEEIQWTAPRPTTLKIILNNGQSFYLTHTAKSWIAKVEGKQYYLLNLPEEERAAESIARILSYAWASEPEKEPEGGEETPPPAEETPEPEEEAPKPEEEIPAEV
jgi:hypothetical protein